MIARAENPGGALGFFKPDGPRGGCIMLHAPTGATGERDIMDFVPDLSKQQQGSRHVELNIVRMRGDCDGRALTHP